MKTSVVLTTYNGEKYIVEQLESIYRQTLLPDEVLIFDDNSMDLTNTLVDNFIQEKSLKNWHHYINGQNLGWQKNFMNAIGRAVGDIIFTCDQDDIWYANKLECMAEVMCDNEHIMLVASDYDSKNNEHSFKYNPKKLEKCIANEKMIYIYRPGCAFCFRRQLYEKILLYWCEGYPNDALLWRYANISDGLYLYHEATIFYRRHEGTATGHETKTIDSRLASAEYYHLVIKGLCEYIDESKNIKQKENKKKLLKNYQRWSELRLEYLRDGHIKLWFLLFPYRKYYYNIKSYVADLFLRGFR